MLLEMKRITKKFGDFTANSDIDFTLKAGEVHSLVGENGAGKTTLMKILYGMEQQTSGIIMLKGKENHFKDPTDAIKNGIGMVHQHFMLFPSLSVAENIVMGSEPGNGVYFNRDKAIEEVEALCDKYNLPIDPRRKVGDCTVGMQQRVEILKVLYQDTDIIILDEPTAVLTPIGVKELLDTIKFLAKQGKSIILITHKLHEVMEVSDRVTVLRNGVVTGEVKTDETSIEELSRMMVGRELLDLRRVEYKPGDSIARLKNVTIYGKKGKPLLDDINLDIRGGEIVGVAGVSGNGQTELIQAITGLQKIDYGEVTLKKEEITNLSVKCIREKGCAHVPEDRFLWGAAGDASIQDNVLMGHHYLGTGLKKHGIFNLKAVRMMADDHVKEFNVKTESIGNKAKTLSGGNLQKLIVARELSMNSPFIIAAEPTRGVDIGAMEFIHNELLKRRDQGCGILLVSSELSEVMTLSDRIIVMFEGKIIGELKREDATKEKIGILMAGGEKHREAV